MSFQKKVERALYCILVAVLIWSAMVFTVSICLYQDYIIRINTLENKMAKELSPARKTALARLKKVGKEQSAYELQIKINTLDALVKRGCATIRFGEGSATWPRSCIYYKAKQEE